MRTLFAKLESPAVTNLSVTFSAGRVDATPGLLPDLYRGEPVVLAARLPRLEGDLTIRGSIGDQPWRVTLPLERRRRAGHLEIVGAPQDRGRRGRPHAAAGLAC